MERLTPVAPETPVPLGPVLKTVAETVETGRGPENSTVAGPSDMETTVHGADGKFGRKVTKDMIDRMRDLRRTGASIAEISWHLLVPDSTVRRYVKDVIAVEAQVGTGSPGSSKLGQAPVVPLSNDGKSSTVVVTQEVTEIRTTETGPSSSPIGRTRHEGTPRISRQSFTIHSLTKL